MYVWQMYVCGWIVYIVHVKRSIFLMTRTLLSMSKGKDCDEVALK